MKPSGPEDGRAKPQELRNLAKSHFQEGRFDEAIAALDQAERNNDATPAALKMRMLALIKLDRAGEAAELMSRMLAVERGDEHWLLGVARMAMRLKHWSTAVDVWSEYRRLKPGDEECLRGLLAAGGRAGQHELVRDAAEALIGMGHEDAGIGQAMVSADIALGNIHRAADGVHRLWAKDESGTAAWLKECEGPWWILVTTMALLEADGKREDMATLRRRLQAAAFGKAMPAEVRRDAVAAYAAYRAADLAGKDSADVRDGLQRARGRLAEVLARDGDASLTTADAMMALGSDEELIIYWKPLMARMAAETDWETAARRLQAALPPRSRTLLVAEMERDAADASPSGARDPARSRGA